MNYRYHPILKWAKKMYRQFKPIPGSPWMKGYVDDFSKICLVPPETLKCFFSECVKILQKHKGEQIGDYLEFGVFNGSSMGSAYLCAKKMQLNSMRFYGFDSFEGLPAGTDDEHDMLQKGFYCCPFEITKECLKKRGVDPDEINWIKGLYCDTLNDETFKTIDYPRIGIVFVDCDTYSSSKSVLDFLAPLITEPAIFCFDDWKLYDMDIKGTGEYLAFNEFLEKNRHIKAKKIKSYNRKSQSFLLLPRTTSRI